MKLVGEEERQFWGQVFVKAMGLPVPAGTTMDLALAAAARASDDAVKLRRERGTAQ